MKKKLDKQLNALVLSIVGMMGFNFIGMEVAKAQDEDEPSEELLEFLSEWETKDGEWLDPFTFLLVSKGNNSENGKDVEYVNHEESNNE